LSGATYLDLGTSPKLNPASLTFSFWIKPNAVMSGEQMIVWNKNAYNDAGWYLTSGSNTEPLRISIGTDPSQPYAVYVSGDRSAFFPAGAWTHIAVTFDNATKAVKFYRNGVQQTTAVAYPATASSVIGDSSVHKSIGWNGPNYKGSFLLAALDDVKLYDQALPYDEILSVYDETAALNPAALFAGDAVLNLPFNGSLADTSPVGNTVTASATESYTAGADGTPNGAVNITPNNAYYISLGTKPDLNPASLTVSFWVKPNGAWSGENILIWTKPLYNQPGWYIGSPNNASLPLVFSVGIGSGGSGSGQPLEFNVVGTRADFFPANVWTHVAVTFDGATREAHIYRNGIEQTVNIGNAGSQGTIADQTGTTKYIGRNGAHNSTLAYYAMDDMVVLKRVLPQNAVIDLLEQTRSLTAAELQALLAADASALALPSSTEQNITLPYRGKNGSSVTWIASSNPGVLSTDGVCKPPASGDTTVTLTAQFEYDGQTLTKDYQVLVGAQSPSDAVFLDNIGTDDVELLDPYLVNNEMNDVNYLLSLDPQRFLYYFYDTAGVPQPAGNAVYNTLNGEETWERALNQNFRGHMFGHWLGSCALAYRSANTSPALKAQLLAKIQAALDGLAACQASYGALYPGRGGYIAPFSEMRLYNLDGVSGGSSGVALSGDTLVPYYDLHKVVEGLLQIYTSFRDMGGTSAATDAARDEALSIVTKFGDYMYDCRVSNAAWSNSKTQGTEYGGFNEAFYELYAITGSVKHLKVAEAFDETSNFQNMANGVDYLAGVHANTTIPKYIGAVKRYEVFTQNPALYATLSADAQAKLTSLYLKAAENFWDIVVRDHTYITGDNSTGEHFQSITAPYGLMYDAVTRNAPETCETCNAYNMLKLTRELFRVTNDKKYSDFYERTFINTIVSSMNPETGGFTYFNPMYSGYYKVTNNNRFWCCQGTGVENHVKYGDSIYFRAGGDIYVNLYYSSVLTLADLNLKLTQQTDIPVSDKATFTVAAASGAGSVADNTNLRFRLPDWVHAAPTVKVNGTAIDPVTEKGYIVVPNAAAGDVIELTLPARVEVWNTADSANFVAFRYGPLVLSATLDAVANTSTGTGTGILVLRSTDPVSQPNTIQINNGQTAAEWKADIANNLKRAPDAMKTIVGKTGTITVPQLRFKLSGTSLDSYTYIPHYMQYQNRYGLYMNLKTATPAPAPKQKPILRYTFDAGTVNGAQVTDVSGNNNDGTLVNGASTQTTSPLNNTLGSSLLLDGAGGYVAMPNNVLNGLVNYTITAWIKPNAVDNWRRVFDMGSTASNHYPNLFLSVSSSTQGQPRFAFETASGSANVTLTTPFSTTAWTHVAVVVNGLGAVFYVNGVKAGENPSFNYSPDAAAQMVNNYLGKSQYPADSYYSGAIDDFRIYNYALSADEAADIARGEEPLRDLDFSATLSLTAQYQAEALNPGNFEYPSVTLIVAYYDAGGRLIQVQSKAGPVAAQGSLNLNGYAPPGAAAAKAFLWDTATYAPLKLAIMS